MPKLNKTPLSLRGYETIVAKDQESIRLAQSLRFHVFAEEMGANLHTSVVGLDRDEVDEYCDHLIVRDKSNGKVIGYSRLLNEVGAEKIGHFYSENEFFIDRVLQLPGRFLEIGRTCIDPGYRGSAVLACLWSGLAEYAINGHYDYMIGSASIPAGPNGFAVNAVYDLIADEQFAPSRLNVHPKVPVPAHLRCDRDECGIPPLLKAYLRIGAWVCGAPYWDEDFNVMDLFILLPVEHIAGRYERHFKFDRKHSEEQVAFNA